MQQQMSLFDFNGNAATEAQTEPKRSVPNQQVASRLARPSHPETSQIAARKTALTLTKAILFSLGWVEETLRQPHIYDVTSYEVDELANREFKTYRNMELPDRVCGKRFGDLKDQGLIKEVGTRESKHRYFRGGRGLVECYELTDKGRAELEKHEKWWLSMTAREYGRKPE